MLDGVRPGRTFPAGESSPPQPATSLGCAAGGSLRGTGTAWGPPDGDGEEGRRLDTPRLWPRVPPGNVKGDVSALGPAKSSRHGRSRLPALPGAPPAPLSHRTALTRALRPLCQLPALETLFKPFLQLNVQNFSKVQRDDPKKTLTPEEEPSRTIYSTVQATGQVSWRSRPSPPRGAPAPSEELGKAPG